MTPAARLAAAIDILDGWQGGGAAEALLTRWARGARYAGSKDRAAVRDIVYDILRRKATVASLGGAEDGRGLVIGWLRFRGEPVEELFTGDGHAPPGLTAAERAHLSGDVAIPAPDVDVPPWLAQMLPGIDDERSALAAAMAERAPLWLRVSRRRGTRAEAAEALARDGLSTRPADTCQTALLVTGNARRLRGAAAYREGLVEIQDLSAQRAVLAVDWPATGRILDYCAGGGGKALAIADLTDASVHAHDIDMRRMADIGPRSERAGVTIPKVVPGQAASQGPFDAVLCDVPCSGSGTWRRDPEAKWRLTPARLEELQARQAAILDDASELVGPGGQLVYMTCSLFSSENRAQIEAFIARQPRWHLDAVRSDTPLTASDGFFSAVLRRVS